MPTYLKYVSRVHRSAENDSLLRACARRGAAGRGGGGGRPQHSCARGGERGGRGGGAWWRGSSRWGGHQRGWPDWPHAAGRRCCPPALGAAANASCCSQDAKSASRCGGRRTMTTTAPIDPHTTNRRWCHVYIITTFYNRVTSTYVRCLFNRSVNTAPKSIQREALCGSRSTDHMK